MHARYHVGLWNFNDCWVIATRLLLLRKRCWIVPQLNVTTLWLLDKTWNNGNIVWSNISWSSWIKIYCLVIWTSWLCLNLNWLLEIRHHLLPLGRQSIYPIAYWRNGMLVRLCLKNVGLVLFNARLANRKKLKRHLPGRLNYLFGLAILRKPFTLTVKQQNWRHLDAYGRPWSLDLLLIHSMKQNWGHLPKG